MAAQSFANFAPEDPDKDKNDPDNFAMGVPAKPDEFGGSGGMATSAVAANAADASPELNAAARLQQTHGTPATDPSRGLMDKPRTAVPGPSTMARTAEEAVASGTVVPGKIETESVTTASKSPETTRKVESEEGKSARRDLEFQKKRIVEATETQMDAESNIDRIALEAEAKRNDLQRQYNEEEDRKRQAIEDDRIAREKAADKELEDADVKVKTAQDAAINWKQARTPLRILQAVLRAASIPDAVRMNPNANPLDNPVARTIDASLEDEKKNAHDKFLQSKEWRDALKTKNAELIKRTYDRETAKLNMEITARARNLLMSEKADQLAQRTAKLDPNGDAYRSSKDLALAKLAADDARDRAAYAQAYDPTVTSGGTTTTTLKKTTEGTKTDALRGTPEEVRGVPDINGKVVGLAPTKEEAVKIREEYGRVKPIMGALDKVSNLVTETGFWERVPGVSGFTDKQQQIKGLTDTMLAPITQFLGAGTPQEAEAKRKIENLSVSVGQGKKVSQKNIDELRNFLTDAYNSRQQALVPGSKTGTVAPKAAGPDPSKLASFDVAKLERLVNAPGMPEEQRAQVRAELERKRAAK